MTVSYRSDTRAALVLTLLTFFTLLATAAPAKQRDGVTSTVAGWVDVQAEVAPYVVLRVVDDSTGVVVRSAPLDATHTFSFAGIVPPVVSVEAVAQLPDHLFELDPASSVMRSAVSSTSAAATVQLRVVATRAAGAGVVAASTSSSVVPTILALAGLVAAWYGRHWLVSALELPTFKPPKQRKIMVAM